MRRMDTNIAARRPLTTTEFAHAMGISPRSVEYLISRGQIRSFKIGRLRRIPASEIDDYPLRQMAPAGRGSTDHFARRSPRSPEGRKSARKAPRARP